MAPEPDDETVYEDIRKGAPPSRARDRGLSVRQLSRFFDATLWKDFGDEGDVGILPSPFVSLNWSIVRVSTLYIAAFLLVW